MNEHTNHNNRPDALPPDPAVAPRIAIYYILYNIHKQTTITTRTTYT